MVKSINAITINNRGTKVYLNKANYKLLNKTFQL